MKTIYAQIRAHELTIFSACVPMRNEEGIKAAVTATRLWAESLDMKTLSSPAQDAIKSMLVMAAMAEGKWVAKEAEGEEQQVEKGTDTMYRLSIEQVKNVQVGEEYYMEGYDTSEGELKGNIEIVRIYNRGCKDYGFNFKFLSSGITYTAGSRYDILSGKVKLYRKN